MTAFNKAREENKQISSRIKQYKTIGNGFEETAKQYSQILEEIEKVKNYIKELQQGKQDN